MVGGGSVVGQLYLSPSISLAIMDTASTLRLDLSLMSDVTLSLYLYHLVQLKRDSYRQSKVLHLKLPAEIISAQYEGSAGSV